MEVAPVEAEEGLCERRLSSEARDVCGLQAALKAARGGAGLRERALWPGEQDTCGPGDAEAASPTC